MRAARELPRRSLVPRHRRRFALLDATTADEVARLCSSVPDLAAMVEHARTVGGPALRALTFHEQASLLKAMAKELGAHKDEFYSASGRRIVETSSVENRGRHPSRVEVRVGLVPLVRLVRVQANHDPVGSGHRQQPADEPTKDG